MRWSAIKLFIDVLLVIGLYAVYLSGADILVTICGMNHWEIRMIGGATACATFYVIMSKVKNALFFWLKCAMVWEISCDEKKTMFETIKCVLRDWKEALEIASCNLMVKALFKQIKEKMNKKELPEFLQSFTEIPLIQYSELLFRRTMDYADECMLLWCYNHDDTFLEESTTGIAVFLEHVVVIAGSAIPMLFLGFVTKVLVTLCVILWYLENCTTTISGITHLLLVCIVCVKVLEDAVIEPMIMNAVLRQYSKHLDEEVTEVSVIVQGIKDTFGSFDTSFRKRGEKCDDKESDDDRSDTGNDEAANGDGMAAS